MALINCPECGREISDTSKNCIHCGYVMKEDPKVVEHRPNVEVHIPKVKSSYKYLTRGIILLMISLVLATITSGSITITDAESDTLYGVSAVMGAVSFIFSIVLLAVPKLRKTKIIIAYLVAAILSSVFIAMTVVLFLTAPLAIVAYIFIFISLFIKDEKN